MVTGKNVNGVMIESAIHIHDLPFTNEKEEHRGAPQFITTISARHSLFVTPAKNPVSRSCLTYLEGAGAGLEGAGAGAWTLTSIFCVPPPPNNRPLKTKAKAKSTSTKITSTATTPALPPPPSSLSPMKLLLLFCRGNWSL
jgi:hypothetical protein